MTTMSTTRLAAALIGLVLAAGCGTAATNPVGGLAPTVAQPRPGGVETNPPAQAGTDGAPPCDPRASYRPSGSADGPTLAAIRQRGLLRVGGQQTYYQLSYRDAVTGEMSGFEVDIARAIATAILGDPNKIQFISLSTAEREAAVQNGTVDIVLASMTMTCERWESVAFSAQYLTAGQRVLVYKSSPVRSIDDLAGKKVCASAGGTNLTALQKAKSKPIPVGATNATDCLVLLQQGQVDAVSTSDAILAGLAAQDRNTHIVGPRFEDAPIGAAMPKGGTDLVRFVNGVMERLRTSGEWDLMYRKWLEPGLGAAQAPQPVYRD